jgi:FMN-dependent NADH-azoreductase
MATLLHINVSPRGNYSFSRQLSNAAVQAWKERNPGGRVIERDLAKTPLTFVDLDWIAGAFSPPEQHNENHKRAIALSDELVSELIEADEIVLATPMYNFAVPAALKAWVDHVVRAGKTFRYTAAGKPEGLLAGKNRKVLANCRERWQLRGGFGSERSGSRGALPAFHLRVYGDQRRAIRPSGRNRCGLARPSFGRGIPDASSQRNRLSRLKIDCARRGDKRCHTAYRPC